MRRLLLWVVIAASVQAQNGYHYANEPVKVAETAPPAWYETAPLPSALLGPAKPLKNGTQLRLRLKQTLISGGVEVGERVRFEVLDDVMVDGSVIIPGGSVVVAGVTKSRDKQVFGRAGRLALTLDYAVAASGEKVRLRGGNAPKGGNRIDWVGGSVTATDLVFYPAWPVMAFVRGADAWIPEGLEVTAFVNGDQSVHTLKS